MTSPSKLSDRTKAIITLGLVFAIIALLIGAAEVAVRVRQYVKHGSSASFDEMYEIDPRTKLKIPRAGADSGRIKINSLGFRSPELLQPKPAGTVRLAFVGASTTFCAEVSNNEATWPYLVADSLREHFAGKAIDFINGGVSGYAVQSSLKNLELRIAPLQPDVILIYHGTNDLSGELRAMAQAQGIGGNLKPPEAAWMSRHSLLWNLVSKNLTVLLAQRQAESGTLESIKFDAEALGTEFREDLRQLVRAAKATGATVALATFAVHMRPGQDNEARRKATESAILYMPGVDFDGLVRAFHRYNDIIREVAVDEGAILIGDEDHIPGNPAHFVDSVHFTDSGSKAQAERVSQALFAAAPVRALFEPLH